MQSPGKKKKTKLEKIAELEGKIKVLKEENARLQGPGTQSSSSSSSDDKLREALKALKQATVKQEMSLQSLRSKARERREEIERKDKMIESLKGELEAMKEVHDKMKTMATSDNATLLARVLDLELALAKEEKRQKVQSQELLASKEDVTSLKSQLDKLRHISRMPSTKSVRSTDSSIASEDMARLKREVARKTEKIVTLEQDLEDAQETIAQLKQKNPFTDNPFSSGQNAVSDDFWSENEEEDDFWG